MTKGCFIVFEGGEGCGKTEQTRRLALSLERAGKTVVTTREPGGEPMAEKIRALLMDPDHHALTPRADFFLFLASRAQHVDKLIKPSLLAGCVVLCDRFEDSTKAYQHFGSGLGPLEELIRCNAYATDGCAPDLKILLDLDPLEGLRRKGKDATTRFDRRAMDFHHRVRQGYLQLAAAEPNWLVVDGSLTPEGVEAMIWETVEKRLALSAVPS